jgi:hypothetical protein
MTPEQQTPASVVERLRENLADSNPSRLVCVESGDLQSVLDAVERLSAEREGLREALEPIARRVVPDHYDDKTLIGWISAGEIRAARAALTQVESRQTGWQDMKPGDVVVRLRHGRWMADVFGDTTHSGGWSDPVDAVRSVRSAAKVVAALPAAPTPADGGGE